MIFMSGLLTQSVSARLWNERREYSVQLALSVRELRGRNNVLDDYAVAQLALVGGVGVEDDAYNLEYSFGGKSEKAPVRVVDGMLRRPVSV
jgi:hypothetical protein